MPQSLRKSLTAWLQFPALPPTPSRKSRPPRSRSDTNSPAIFSTTFASIEREISSTFAKNSDACDTRTSPSPGSTLVGRLLSTPPPPVSRRGLTTGERRIPAKIGQSARVLLGSKRCVRGGSALAPRPDSGEWIFAPLSPEFRLRAHG